MWTFNRIFAAISYVDTELSYTNLKYTVKKKFHTKNDYKATKQYYP
jgi:hypothetical protein